MQNYQETIDEKDFKKGSKSRKIIKKRNDSVVSSNKSENTKELEQNTLSSNKRNTNGLIFGESNTEFISIEQYKSKVKELTDDKQNLLDLIHSNEKEIDFLNSIIFQFVDLNELMKIKQKSVYDENSRLWTIPNFLIQHRKTVFPKLQRTQIKEAAQNEIKNRKIVFKPNVSPPVYMNNIENEEDCAKKFTVISAVFGEVDARPVTSVAKYRQGSMNKRDIDFSDDHRRSPMLRKKKL